MNEELLLALQALLYGPNAKQQRNVILLDMLWKMVRKDWHGVSDGANDLRELGL